LEVVLVRSGMTTPGVGSLRWRGAVAVVAIGAVAAACGGGDPAVPSDADPAASPTTVAVEVYFSQGVLEESCAEVYPVTREVDAADPLAGALEALLAGPTAAEQAEGFGGWFTSATAGMLLGAEVVDGVAYVDLGDLREVIPSATSACGSELLLAQLDRTVQGVVDVDHVEYALDGEAETFYGWLQYDVPSRAPSAPLTVADVTDAMERELEAETMTPRQVTVACDTEGPLTAGEILFCSLSSDPPEPADWGTAIVVVLADDLVAWSAATDNPGSSAQLRELYDAAPTGLTCAQLLEGAAPYPFDVATMDEVGGYFWSVVYWTLEGRPARMDADVDGTPCETLYPDGAVASVLLTVPR
jgi:hypothetical protein